MTAAKTVDDWLAELINAAPEDRTLVGILGVAAGLALARFLCTNPGCRPDWFTFTGAVAHLRRRPDIAHQPGDFRPYAPEATNG